MMERNSDGKSEIMIFVSLKKKRKDNTIRFAHQRGGSGVAEFL